MSDFTHEQDRSHQQTPFELYQLLSVINGNINDVKERVIRMEAQDFSLNLKELQHEVKAECEKRQTLENTVLELKTRFAPILVALTIVATATINYVIRGVH